MLNLGLPQGETMEIDRTKRPQTSNEIKFNVPEIDFNKLKNGLKIFFSKKNGKLSWEIKCIIKIDKIFI